METFTESGRLRPGRWLLLLLVLFFQPLAQSSRAFPRPTNQRSSRVLVGQPFLGGNPGFISSHNGGAGFGLRAASPTQLVSSTPLSNHTEDTSGQPLPYSPSESSDNPSKKSPPSPAASKSLPPPRSLRTPPPGTNSTYPPPPPSLDSLSPSPVSPPPAYAPIDHPPPNSPAPAPNSFAPPPNPFSTFPPPAPAPLPSLPSPAVQPALPSPSPYAPAPPNIRVPAPTLDPAYYPSPEYSARVPAPSLNPNRATNPVGAGRIPAPGLYPVTDPKPVGAGNVPGPSLNPVTNPNPVGVGRVPAPSPTSIPGGLGGSNPGGVSIPLPVSPSVAPNGGRRGRILPPPRAPGSMILYPPDGGKPPAPASSSSPSPATIGGIVTGIVVLVALLVCLYFVFCRNNLKVPENPHGPPPFPVHSSGSGNPLLGDSEMHQLSPYSSHVALGIPVGMTQPPHAASSSHRVSPAPEGASADAAAYGGLYPPFYDGAPSMNPTQQQPKESARNMWNGDLGSSNGAAAAADAGGESVQQHELEGKGRSNPSSSPSAASPWEIELQASMFRRVSLPEVLRATDNFSRSNFLGEGAFAKVYRGECSPPRPSAPPVVWAVKRSKLVASGFISSGKGTGPAAVSEFENEVVVMSRFSHRCLVRLLGYCAEEGEQILLYEFVEGGSLAAALHGWGRSNQKGREQSQQQQQQQWRYQPASASSSSVLACGPCPLDLRARLGIAIGTAEALLYLHASASPSIAHRDVKPDNILLDRHNKPKLADFGLLKDVGMEGGSSQSVYTRVAGTPGYLDPDYHLSSKATTRGDVYSFGVVLLELFSGRRPILRDPRDSLLHQPHSGEGGEGADADAAAADHEHPDVVHISQWAGPLLQDGDVEAFSDPRLDIGCRSCSSNVLREEGGASASSGHGALNGDPQSSRSLSGGRSRGRSRGRREAEHHQRVVLEVGRIGMECVQVPGKRRPGMAEVVRRLVEVQGMLEEAAADEGEEEVLAPSLQQEQKQRVVELLGREGAEEEQEGVESSGSVDGFTHSSASSSSYSSSRPLLAGLSGDASTPSHSREGLSGEGVSAAEAAAAAGISPSAGSWAEGVRRRAVPGGGSSFLRAGIQMTEQGEQQQRQQQEYQSGRQPMSEVQPR